MLLSQILGALPLAALPLLVSASPIGDETMPEVLAIADFPESNPFGHVVNGERNVINVSVENKSDRNVTLISVGGSLQHPDTDVVVKNLTASKYNIPLLEGVKMQVPYTFHSEFKPGDLRLNVWIEHTGSTEDEIYRVPAYDSVVSVVEPESSVFDLKLISTYLMVLGLLGGLGYFTYLSFAPQPKKKSRKADAQSVSAPVGTVTATGAGGYQEEWIPEHHLRKPKTGRKKSGIASGTSGDELSGAETSGAEGKKRKGRK